MVERSTGSIRIFVKFSFGKLVNKKPSLKKNALISENWVWDVGSLFGMSTQCRLSVQAIFDSIYRKHPLPQLLLTIIPLAFVLLHRTLAQYREIKLGYNNYQRLYHSKMLRKIFCNSFSVLY